MNLNSTWRAVRTHGARPARYAAGIAVSAVFVWLLVRRADFGTVWRTITHAEPAYLVPIAAILLLRYWWRAVRWRHLVRHIRDVSSRDALPRVVLSQVADQILPFSLGYVLMVEISAEKFQIGRSQLFGAEAVERMLDGLVFALFLAIAVVTLSIGAAFTALTIFMLAGTLTGLALAWWGTRRAGMQILPASWPFASVVHRFLEGLAAIQHWSQTRDVFLLTVLTWGTDVLLYWVVGLALRIHVPPFACVFLVAAGNIGAAIPLAEASVGFVFLAQQALVAVGQPADVATAYALSVQALLVAPIVILGPLSAYDLRLRLRDLFPGRSSPPQSGGLGEEQAAPRR